MKFKVVTGSHIQDGVVYTKDQIVETHINLAEKFKGKFQQVGGEEPARTLAPEDEDKDTEPKVPEGSKLKTLASSKSIAKGKAAAGAGKGKAEDKWD